MALKILRIFQRQQGQCLEDGQGVPLSELMTSWGRKSAVRNRDAWRRSSGERPEHRGTWWPGSQSTDSHGIELAAF